MFGLFRRRRKTQPTAQVVGASGSHRQPPTQLDLTTATGQPVEPAFEVTSWDTEPFERLGSRRPDVVAELVPEPGNRHDSHAVAVHVNGQRVGYLDASVATYWHDLIRLINAQGSTVTTRGRINWAGPDIYIALPDRGGWNTLAHQFGLLAQVDALLAGVPADVLQRSMARPSSVSPVDMASLQRTAKQVAPSISWRRGYGGPHELPRVVRDALRDRRETERHRQQQASEEQQAATRRRAEEQRQAEAERREQQRETERQRALEMWNAGESKAAIARALGCGDNKVTALLQEAGAQPREAGTANVDARAARLERARHALALQRQGKTRQEIATELDVSVATVKELLTDARFYETPDSNPERLRIAELCAQARAMTRAQIIAEYDLSETVVRRGLRDAEALGLPGT